MLGRSTHLAGCLVAASYRVMRPPSLTLCIVVMIWWLLIAMTIVILLPGQEAAVAQTAGVPMEGQAARIDLRRTWPLLIPVDRWAYDHDAGYDGFRSDDLDGITLPRAGSAWIKVWHDQLVRVVAVDGDAVQVEVLEGYYRGGLGWLAARQLGPSR